MVLTQARDRIQSASRYEGYHVSGRGIDFLENWVQQNITVADKNCTQQRAIELAALCSQGASQLGITVDDMEPEFGSVESIIYDASHNDFDAELEFWKAYAAARDK
jgi:hypothetical protein